MSPSILIGVLLLLAVSGYYFGRAGAVGAAGGERLAVLHSTPAYHGLYVALWCAVPALIVALVWIALEGRIVHSIVLCGIGPDTLATWARTAISEPGASAAVDALSRGGVDALDPSQRELLWLQ